MYKTFYGGHDGPPGVVGEGVGTEGHTHCERPEVHRETWNVRQNQPNRKLVEEKTSCGHPPLVGVRVPKGRPLAGRVAFRGVATQEAMVLPEGSRQDEGRQSRGPRKGVGTRQGSSRWPEGPRRVVGPEGPEAVAGSPFTGRRAPPGPPERPVKSTSQWLGVVGRLSLSPTAVTEGQGVERVPPRTCVVGGVRSGRPGPTLGRARRWGGTLLRPEPPPSKKPESEREEVTEEVGRVALVVVIGEGFTGRAEKVPKSSPEWRRSIHTKVDQPSRGDR